MDLASPIIQATSTNQTLGSPKKSLPEALIDAKQYEDAENYLDADLIYAQYPSDSVALAKRGEMRMQGRVGVEQNFYQAFDFFKRAADQKERHPVACKCVGDLYRAGNGVAQSFSSAIEYYQRAVQLDVSDALVCLGDMYKQGQGVAQSDEEWVIKNRQAAELNNPAAWRNLAIAYEKGIGVFQNALTANKCLAAAAILGDKNACIALGWIYANSDLKNAHSKAIEWFEKAGEKGNPGKWCMLGIQHQCGLNGVVPDHALAMRYFEQVKKSGDGMACFSIGHLFAGINNSSRAIEYYQKAADDGNSDAWYAIGTLKLHEHDGHLKARDFFQKAADAGHMICLAMLGHSYRVGGGGREKNAAKALEYLLPAAQKGSPCALSDIAKVHKEKTAVLSPLCISQTSFDLSGINIADEVMEYLADELAKNSSLKSLTLADCTMSARALELLACALQKNNTLTLLDLRGIKITDQPSQPSGSPCYLAAKVVKDDDSSLSNQLACLIPGEVKSIEQWVLTSIKNRERPGYSTLLEINNVCAQYIYSIFKTGSVSAIEHIATGNADIDREANNLITQKAVRTLELQLCLQNSRDIASYLSESMRH